MARIAEFAAEEPEVVTTEEAEPDTFAWFGQEYRTNPEFSELDFLDFTEVATNMNELDPRALVAVKDLLVSQIHPDDFDAFWKQTRSLRLPFGDRLTKLMLLTQALTAAATGRPTVEPSGSSSGQPGTVGSSKDGSSSPGSPASVTSDPKVSRVLADIGSGRPDLGQVVLQAHERRSEGLRAV